MRKLITVTLVALAALLAGSGVSRASVTYDPTTSFSIASNPNGVWSYGYLNPSGSDFTAYALSTSAWHTNTNLEAWSQFTYDSSSYSVVGKNPTGTTQMESPTGSISIDPGLLFMHPGGNGEKADIRFTSPAGGVIDINAVFKAADLLGGNRDVHVYVNGVDQIPGSLLIGSKSAATPISASLDNIHVSAGTTVDFAVGYGSDNVYYNDATTLAANITLSPEPASVVIWGLAIGAGLVVARRRRRAT